MVITVADGAKAKISDLASLENIRAEAKIMICTARKDIRRKKGNARVNATSLAFFIKPYKDPQGNAVVTRIVGVAANDDLTPCTCRAGRLDNCTCLPDARLQDDRTVLLSPMVTPNVNSKAAAGGRQYKVSFESKSAATGLA